MFQPSPTSSTDPVATTHTPPAAVQTAAKRQRMDGKNSLLFQPLKQVTCCSVIATEAFLCPKKLSRHGQ